MSTVSPTDIWPAKEGLETLADFEHHRNLTLRATQKALKTICDTYLKPATSILEIGSGTGFLARNVPSEYHNHWIQLESQPAFLKVAQQHHPYGKYIEGSAYNLPFPDKSIDTIIGYCSFDVLSDIDTAISELARVLSPNGTFIHLLDLGVDYNLLHQEFQQQRIPSYSKSQSNSILPGMSNTTKTFYYLPKEHLDAFLADVNMTTEEMDSLQKIDLLFAFEHYKQKYNCDFDGVIDYLTLFEQHAKKLDTNHYFHTKLQHSLQKHFSAKSIEYNKISAHWQGKRTNQQIQQYPKTYVFEQNQGTINFGSCLYTQWPQYQLHQRLQPKFPKIASVIEPSCTEVATLECVIGKKI